jgi:hypothetical protein
VRLPNGDTMESSHTGQLDIPKFNAAASKAHVSTAWPIILYYQLDSHMTNATHSLSSKTQSQSTIPETPKF